MPGIADRQVLCLKRRFTADAFTGDALLPPGPTAIVGDTSLTILAVPEIPRVLHARAAGAGAARHHALLERAEGAGQAVVTTAAAVLHAPGPVGDGGSRARIDRGGGGNRKQGESGADHDHGYAPNTARPWNEHPAGAFLPVVDRGAYRQGHDAELKTPCAGVLAPGSGQRECTGVAGDQRYVGRRHNSMIAGFENRHRLISVSDQARDASQGCDGRQNAPAAVVDQ